MSKICNRCSNSFTCEAAKGQACWCFNYPALLPIKKGGDCLCPDCLKEKVNDAIDVYVAEVKAGKRSNEAFKYNGKNKQLMEGIDYYMDQGLFVMTSWFHLKRGFCCGNGCKHCPYDYVNVPNNKH